MGRNKHRCDYEIKRLLLEHKCCTTQSHTYEGWALEMYFEVSFPLEQRKQYHLCHNIVLQLQQSRIQTTLFDDIPASPISSINYFDSSSYNSSTVSSSEDILFYEMTRGHKNKFLEDVHNTKVNYKKKYRDLFFQEKLNREESVAKDIIGSCANTGNLMQDSYKYLQKNKQVAIRTFKYSSIF